MLPKDMSRIPKLVARGITARLVGTNLWTVDDTGWIYEARLTQTRTWKGQILWLPCAAEGTDRRTGLSQVQGLAGRVPWASFG